MKFGFLVNEHYYPLVSVTGYVCYLMIILTNKVLVTFELSTFHNAALLNGSLFISDLNPLILWDSSTNPLKSFVCICILELQIGKTKRFLNFPIFSKSISQIEAFGAFGVGLEESESK
jgi:hypothetical protein